MEEWNEMASPESLDDLLHDELRDLLDAEHQITKALPRMARAVASPALRQGLEQHLRETHGQIARLEQAFRLIDERPRRKTCQGVKGLIDEAKELMSEIDRGPVLDGALIAAAQKVEHYEISAYGTLRTYATLLGKPRLADLFDTTLQEEKAADQKLTSVAEAMVNPEAAEGQAADDEGGLTAAVGRTVGSIASRAAALAGRTGGLPGPGRERSRSKRSTGSRARSAGTRTSRKK
jgi:ferritin-like metal-binding protein YciE